MIVFQRVTKQFGQNAPALSEVSFNVNNGEFIFLTGHSGSGKSTLLKLITNEYTPDEGEIRFNGNLINALRGAKIHNHRRQIGVVFQDYRLLPELNVWENIALALEIIGKPKAEIEERVTDLLELVQLTDKAYFFPAELSGGEAQRVSIARALATAPNVLLADEPTGNLDPETTMMIARLFNKIHELGTTILFATHDVSVLSTLPHRRIHLDKGKIVSDSTLANEPKPAPEPTSTPAVTSEPAPKNTTAPSTIIPPKKKSWQWPQLRLPSFRRQKKPDAAVPKSATLAEPTDSVEQVMTQMLIKVETLD